MIRALLLLTALAAPALAADKPPTVPQRDVDVQYQIAGRTPDGSPRNQRIRWSVATGKMRVDAPSPGLYMIGDYRTGQMEVVKSADRSVLDMGPGSFVTNPGNVFTRLDNAQVAGLACTNWQTADNGGQPTVLCLTADGVMLRASHGDEVLVEATAVSFAPQDPADFVPPDGFRHISPAGPPAAPNVPQ